MESQNKPGRTTIEFRKPCSYSRQLEYLPNDNCISFNGKTFAQYTVEKETNLFTENTQAAAPIPDWLGDKACILIAGRPSAANWMNLATELSLINREIFFWLIYYNKPIHLIDGQPITNHPALMQYRGKKVDKGGSNRTFDELPGVGDPITIRTDRLFNSGSASLLCHEVFHTVDQYILHNASSQPWWLAVHEEVRKSQNHIGWRDYELEFPDEALAETYARNRRRLPNHPAADRYIKDIFKAYRWTD